MNPKKAKHYIKPTAERMDVSEKLVDNVVSFYWAAVRRALTELESPSITVVNFGTFKIKPGSVKKLNDKYQSYIDNLNPDNLTFQKHAIYNVAKDRLKRLENIQRDLDEEVERKKEKKQLKEKYVTNKTMETPREDSGRSEE